MKIIDDVVKELTVPYEVECAQNYIRYCHRDMGFIGSPEYDRQKKIVNDYYEPIIKREKSAEELALYLKLKQTYGADI